MDLEQLRRFEAVVRLGTIAAAADELGVTPSTLCRSLKALEADCGHELFDHLGNSVVPNRVGHQILGEVRALLNDEKALRRKLDGLVRREFTVCVGTCAPGPMWELSRIIVERFPGTFVSPVVIGSHQPLVERLLNRTVDLAITLRPVELPGVETVQFCDESISASIPDGHPLAARASLGFRDLDGEPLLVAEGIGFWTDVLRRVVPSSRLVMQPDHQVHMQMMRTTSMLGFESNCSQDAGMITGRTSVPIDDEKAHASYWINLLADAPSEVHAIARETRRGVAGIA